MLKSPPAIEVENLIKDYKTIRAVDGISLSIASGSITGLLGGNGAGKTTTISSIMGVLRPTSGTVRVLGTDMNRERHRVLHRMNFQSPYVDLPGRLTVRQNLVTFARLYGVADPKARTEQLAAELELGELLDRPTGKLSAGQKTRVALAKSLVNDPEVLLLDEPTASLDPETAGWVRDRIARHSEERGATILLASHNMREVERLCQRVVFMRRGKIVDDATPKELLKRYGRKNLEDVFIDVARGQARQKALEDAL
jgi:ABC-2 type transport system ATP-binding protein